MDGLEKDLLSDACADSAILGRAAPRRGYGPSSAAPARARDLDRSRRPARPGRSAATFLVLGLVLLGAAVAEAQTPRILVSNAAQGSDDEANTSGNDHAQLFHTGDHTAGYMLTSVIVNSEDAEGDAFDVEICGEDGSVFEFPNTICTALTAPASFTAGNLEFIHAGLALMPGTNYVVVIKPRSGANVRINSTTSSGEDSTGLSNWSIKNFFYWNNGGTWTNQSGGNEALRITVNGYEVVANPPQPLPPTTLTEVWTATLTVGTSGSLVGFSGGGGALSDTMFSYGGTSYTIDGVSIVGGALAVRFSGSVLGADAANLELHIGTEEYLFSAASISSTDAYFWTSNVPTWADGGHDFLEDR